MARETGEYVHGVAWDARLADHGALRGRVAGGRAVERRRHAGSTSPGPALEPRIINEPVIAFFDSPVATLRCRSSPLRALGDARPIPLQAVGRPYAARVKDNAANAGRSAKRQAAPMRFAPLESPVRQNAPMGCAACAPAAWRSSLHGSIGCADRSIAEHFARPFLPIHIPLHFPRHEQPLPHPRIFADVMFQPLPGGDEHQRHIPRVLQHMRRPAPREPQKIPRPDRICALPERRLPYPDRMYTHSSS